MHEVYNYTVTWNFPLTFLPFWVYGRELYGEVDESVLFSVGRKCLSSPGMFAEKFRMYWGRQVMPGRKMVGYILDNGKTCFYVCLLESSYFFILSRSPSSPQTFQRSSLTVWPSFSECLIWGGSIVLNKCWTHRAANESNQCCALSI